MGAADLPHDGRLLGAARRHADSVRDELEAAVLSREPGSAPAIAERFGVSERLVVRTRQKLRAQGRTVMVVDHHGEPAEWGGGSPVSKLSEATREEVRQAILAGGSDADIAQRFSMPLGTVRYWRSYADRPGAIAKAPMKAPGGRCERCADRKAIATVNGWSVCATCEPRERERAALPVAPHLLVGPVPPMEPGAVVECQHYLCYLSANACVARQETRRKAPAQATDQAPRAPHEYCASGQCQQGALVKLRLGKRYREPNQHEKQQRINANVMARARALRAASVLPPPRAPRDAPAPLLRAAIERRDREENLAGLSDMEAADERRSAELTLRARQRCAEPAEAVLANPARRSSAPERAPGAPRRSAAPAAAPPPVIVAPLPFDPPAPPRPPVPAVQPRQEEVMPNKSRIANLTDQEIQEALKKYGSVSATANALDTSWGTLKSRLDAIAGKGSATPAEKPRIAQVTAPSLATVLAAAAGVRHRVELPDVEHLPLEYLLACIEYGRTAQSRLGAALDGKQGLALVGTAANKTAAQ